MAGLPMVFLRGEAVRWVDDEPQPGLAEARFTDAHHHQQWAIIDKWPVFSGDDLTPDSRYPVEVGVLCGILSVGSTSGAKSASGHFQESPSARGSVPVVDHLNPIRAAAVGLELKAATPTALAGLRLNGSGGLGPDTRLKHGCGVLEAVLGSAGSVAA